MVLEAPCFLSDLQDQENLQNLVKEKQVMLSCVLMSCGVAHLQVPLSPDIPLSPFCPTAPETRATTVLVHHSVTSDTLIRLDGCHLLSPDLLSHPLLQGPVLQVVPWDLNFDADEELLMFLPFKNATEQYHRKAASQRNFRPRAEVPEGRETQEFQKQETTED